MNNVKVLYTNIRSLTSGNKRDELQILTDSENIDIIGITETLGQADISDGKREFQDINYIGKTGLQLITKKVEVWHFM